MDSKQTPASILAKACKELGLKPSQVRHLAAAVSETGMGPGGAEWQQATRLMSEYETNKLDKFQRETWFNPEKLGWSDIEKGFARDLPELTSLLSLPMLKAEFNAMYSQFNPREKQPVERLLNVIGLIGRMPKPNHKGFHLVGRLFHYAASTGNRRGMMLLSFHLRAMARFPYCRDDLKTKLYMTAMQWERLARAFWRIEPRWNGEHHFLRSSIDPWSNADRMLKKVDGKLDVILADGDYFSKDPSDTR